MYVVEANEASRADADMVELDLRQLMLGVQKMLRRIGCAVCGQGVPIVEPSSIAGCVVES
jgi:hypothetical protein